MQSKKQSLIECICDTSLGLILSLGITSLVLNLMAVPRATEVSLTLVGVLTVVSITRSYLVRRYFNGKAMTPTTHSGDRKNDCT